MDVNWLITLLPIIGLSVNVLSQILSVHASSRIGLSMLLGLFAGAVVCGSIVLGVSSADIISKMDMMVVLTSYLALSFCFLAFLNLNITSLRIRMLRELLRRDAHGLKLEDINSLYSSAEMFDRRLDRLVRTGQIVRKENKWVIKSNKLIFFVTVSKWLRMLIFSTSDSHAIQK